MLYVGDDKYRVYVGNTAMIARYKEPEYIKDGLIAHLDAIDNAGIGEHDSNASVWVDLTGNGHDINVGNYMGTQLTGWEDDALVAKSCYNVPFNTPCSNYVTIEIGFYYNGYQALFNSGDGLNKFVAVHSNGTVQFYNAGNKNAPYISNNKKVFISGVHYPAVNSPLVYSNGVFKSYTSSDTWGKNSSPTCLGRGANSYQFKGKYYYIRLYNRALSQEEIMHNFIVDKRRFNVIT